MSFLIARVFVCFLIWININKPWLFITNSHRTIRFKIIKANGRGVRNTYCVGLLIRNILFLVFGLSKCSRPVNVSRVHKVDYFPLVLKINQLNYAALTSRRVKAVLAALTRLRWPLAGLRGDKAALGGLRRIKATPWRVKAGQGGPKRIKASQRGSRRVKEAHGGPMRVKSATWRP
ncbi:hypothetical protein ACLB2K_062219 [Fragaria x ananassa]